MSIEYEPPPQISEFNHIWRRWLYGFYEKLNNRDAWKSAVFENGWVNIGSPFNNAEYMRDALGFVHLRGYISSGTMATSAFTLPVNYRPGSDELFVTSSNDRVGSLTITSAGGVIPRLGSNISYSLDGVTFKAA